MVEVKRLRELGKFFYLKYITIVSREKSREVNVKIKIKIKISWANKIAVRIKFPMLIIRSDFLARKRYEQRI